MGQLWFEVKKLHDVFSVTRQGCRKRNRMYRDFLPHHSSGITKKGQDANQLVVSEDIHCLALKTGMTTSSSWEQVCVTLECHSCSAFPRRTSGPKHQRHSLALESHPKPKGCSCELWKEAHLKSECPNASDKVSSQYKLSSFLTSSSYRAPSYLAPICYPSFSLMENRGVTTA